MFIWYFLEWRFMSYGIRLRKIRDKLNLSQQEFAEKLHTTQATVSRYEKDLRMPDADFLEKLTELYHLNINWLLTGKGEMFLGQTSQTSEFQANNNELEKQQKRLQDLQKQVDLLKKNIQEIDIEYDQEKKRSSDLIHENQKLNRELLTLMRDLIDCKNLVIKLQQK